MMEPVYFLNLQIEGFRCFKQKQILDLSDGKGNWKKWTVILGDNGTGKSTLLQLLAGAEMKEHKREQKSDSNLSKWYTPKYFDALSSGSYPPEGIEDEFDGYCRAGLNIYRTEKGEFSKVVEVRFHQNYPVLQRVFEDDRSKELKCFGYGANRKIGTSSLSSELTNNFETLFNEDAKLLNAEEWLLQLDYAASKTSNIKAFALKKRDQVIQILIDLLPDINAIRFTEPTKASLKSTVEFQTPFYWISIQQLSLGYKTMVAWMVDLAARMFERYPDSDNPLAEPAIVLVDEIDLHLHPKWQRNIFDYLSDKFSQTQFIVTAHSPLIVQSAPRDANIVLLRKEDDHVIIDNEHSSVQNWRLDQILTSDLFGLNSARGTDAEEKLAERKHLLGKENLSGAEKQRLEELNDFANNLPTAYNGEDIDAMSIIREAAAYLKNSKK